MNTGHRAAFLHHFPAALPTRRRSDLAFRPRETTVLPQCKAIDIQTRFGQRLRELRQERHLTQMEMARKFGIDRSFISDVERGRKSISLSLLEVIALGLRLSLADMMRDL